MRTLAALAAFLCSSSACNAVLTLDQYHEVTGCAHNAECIAQAGGQPAVCTANHTCAALLNDDCPKVIGPVESDNALLLGALFTLKGTNQSSGVSRMNSVELAVGEISQTIVGLPGGPGGKPRPLVVLECDDSSDNTVASRSAQHMQDVGVLAILGPSGSGVVTAVAQSVTIPGGTFIISPSATSATLTGLSQFVWRTAPSDVLQSIALRDQIPAIEAQFRAANPTVTNVKLAVIYQGNPYGQGLLDSMSKGLVLNGVPLTDPKNTGLYEPKSYDPTSLDPTTAAAQVLSESSPPNLIALFGTSEIITKFMTPVEASWPGGAPRPVYLVSDAGKKQELLDLTKGNDPLRVRVRGTVPGTNGPLFQAFSLRYQGKFGQVPAVFGMAGAYDSTYLVAYALTSIGSQPVTGAAIAGAMSKMLTGTATATGPDALSSAMQTLSSGNSIDVQGASGPLDFDLNAHEAPSDIDVWCIVNASGATSFASSGRHYDSATQTMTGTYACP